MVSFSEIEEGYEIPPYIKGPITREQLKEYAKASGDGNPIHTDESIAVMAGLKGVIAHGLLDMAYLIQGLVNWLGEDGQLKDIDVQFRGMVRPGDMVHSKAKVIKKYQEGGKKFLDLEIWQEAVTPIATIASPLTMDKMEPPSDSDVKLYEAAYRGWIKEGQKIIMEQKKEQNKIEHTFYGVQNSIIGNAKVELFK
ncbi:MAG: MaoC/PaaZ C-terminal domain-containing protein [Candidatus Jordarchaeum sp.]|uniref:MaoC/PaaZ C-terminal domain-containing protein n=1 Tax=Candidatus Jordarchaeum sp. TaxID=2823881 RepID=UPI00404AB760